MNVIAQTRTVYLYKNSTCTLKTQFTNANIHKLRFTHIFKIYALVLCALIHENKHTHINTHSHLALTQTDIEHHHYQQLWIYSGPSDFSF